MVDSPPARRTHPYLTATVVVLVLLAGYVGGYFWLGEYERLWDPALVGPLIMPDQVHVRSYSHLIVKSAYVPLGWVECRLRGEHVLLLTTDDPLLLESTLFDPP